MGRDGTGVGFGPVEPEPSDPSRPSGFFADRFDRFGFMVDEVVEAEHRIGIANARRAEAIERARQASEAIANDPPSGKPTTSSVEMARRGFVAEIAAALRLPGRTAERLIRTSQTLVGDLPATLLALGEGRLSYRHAQILVDNSYGLEPVAVRELEARMLPLAAKNTPSRFEQSVRRTRERLNPETMAARHAAAIENRSTELVPEADGMAFVGAHVAAVVGVAIDDRLTTIARTLQCDGETRTLTELKADVFADILLDNYHVDNAAAGHPAGQGDGPVHRFRSIRPTVLVTVPALTLLGRGDQPGTVEGYGPIDPQTAREIASFAPTLRRLITDPVTGVVLSFDRRRYRVPKDLRTWLRVRDGTCRFPGCNRRAGNSDIDHTDDWALGGPTNHDNLAHLCPSHHALKGADAWKVTQTGGGTLKWTSPTNIHYQTDPQTGTNADT
jgi:Domain of unknown function (DUF222)